MDWPQVFLLIAAFLFSLSVHECAHAWTALRLGDPTGYSLGRVTLNPLPHIDPVGTLLVPGVLLVSTGGAWAFGWAKPVPYQPFLLRNPFLGSSAVAGAGPASNFALALLSAALLGVVSPDGSLTGTLGHDFLRKMVLINVLLGIFNLVPLAPLDGATVVAGLLPRGAAAAWARFEAVGPVLFLVLLVTGMIGKLISAPVAWTHSQLLELARGIRG